MKVTIADGSVKRGDSCRSRGSCGRRGGLLAFSTFRPGLRPQLHRRQKEPEGWDRATVCLATAGDAAHNENAGQTGSRFHVDTFNSPGAPATQLRRKVQGKDRINALRVQHLPTADRRAWRPSARFSADARGIGLHSRADLLGQTLKIEIIPAFDDLPVFDSEYCYASELNRFV